MKTLFAAAAMALALPSMAAAATADLAGSWNITLTTPQGDLPVTCTLAQATAALTGSCGGGMMAASPTTGTVTDDNFTLAYDVTFGGTPLHVVYNGHIEPDGHIAGAFTAGPYNGSFTGAKGPPPAAAPAAPAAPATPATP